MPSFMEKILVAYPHYIEEINHGDQDDSHNSLVPTNPPSLVLIVLKLDRKHPERASCLFCPLVPCNAFHANKDLVSATCNYGGSSLLRYKKRGIVHAILFHLEKSETLSLVENHSSKHASTLAKRMIACLDVRTNDEGGLVVTKGDQYDVREHNEKCQFNDWYELILEVAFECFKLGADKISIGSDVVDVVEYLKTTVKVEKSIHKEKLEEKKSYRDYFIFSKQRHSQEAVKVFSPMECVGMKPNHVTFGRVISACAYQEALKQGKEIHGHAIKIGFDSDVFVGNTLVSVYANANIIEDVCKIFEKFPRRDVVLWTAMIAICASHDRAKEALQLFKEMQRASIKPDHIYFLGVSSAWLIFLVELDCWMRKRI
eukprot:Gb_41303 [translate_table: standard]